MVNQRQEPTAAEQRRLSVQLCGQLVNLALDAFVARSQSERSPELLDRFDQLAALHVDMAQIDVGEVARFIAGGLFGPLEPGNRRIELIALHQVDADVVVGIAEIGIDFDRVMAFLDRLIEFALMAERPAQIGVTFGRGENVERVALKLDRAVHFPLFLGV